MGSTLLIIIAVFGLGLAAQAWVKRAHRKGSDVRAASGLTGAEAARRVLDGEGLYDVQVIREPGQLTDHYDPKTRTVHLSESNYDRPTPAGIAVAIHEVGHALQHAQGSAYLRARTAIAPAAMTASMLWFVPLMIGLMAGLAGFVWIAIAIYAFVILFHVVTLPVEFDASRRAGALMKQYALVTPEEGTYTRTVLTAAASTYVVAAISSVAIMLAYVLPMLGGRE